MKKIFRLVAILFVILASGIARAEWMLVGSTDQADFYVDKTTVVKQGSKSKMWSMQNLKKGMVYQGNLVLSTKDYQEFDCQLQTMRLLSSTAYSKSMGSGAVVLNIDGEKNLQKPTPVAPETPGRTLWKVACNK